MPRLPTLFLSHGSPMTALEPGAAGAFMTRLGPAINATFGAPRAILGLSAHSLARQPVLLAGDRHRAVHDFGEFDPRLNDLRYDVAGAPGLAQQTSDLLATAGIAVQALDRGGLDHGLWTPLRYMYPTAEIPVLPLAFSPEARPHELYALGQALAPLADDGVLILASGSITHNLRWVFDDPRPPVDAMEAPECRAFRDWVGQVGAAGDWPALFDYRALAPHAALMHPSDEHWLPWYVAGGAAGDRATAHRVHESVTYGCLGMDAYAFGANARTLAEALS